MREGADSREDKASVCAKKRRVRSHACAPAGKGRDQTSGLDGGEGWGKEEGAKSSPHRWVGGSFSPAYSPPPSRSVCGEKQQLFWGGREGVWAQQGDTALCEGGWGAANTPPPLSLPPPHPPQPGLWGGGHRPARPRVKGGGGCGEAACPPSILWNTAGGYADGSGEEPRRFPTGSRALSWYRETMAEGSEESATPLTPGCSLRTLLRGGFTLCRTPIPHPFTSGFTPFLVCVPPASSRGRRGLDTYCNFVSSRFSFCWST